MQISPDSTSINITWTTKDIDIVHGYEIQYNYSIRECQSNSEVMNVLINDGNVNGYTLYDVEEDSDFTISLIAINPAGKSRATTETATTLQAGTYSFMLPKGKHLIAFTCSSYWSSSGYKHFFNQLNQHHYLLDSCGVLTT